MFSKHGMSVQKLQCDIFAKSPHDPTDQTIYAMLTMCFQTFGFFKPKTPFILFMVYIYFRYTFDTFFLFVEINIYKNRETFGK